MDCKIMRLYTLASLNAVEDMHSTSVPEVLVGSRTQGSPVTTEPLTWKNATTTASTTRMGR